MAAQEECDLVRDLVEEDIRAVEVDHARSRRLSQKRVHMHAAIMSDMHAARFLAWERNRLRAAWYVRAGVRDQPVELASSRSQEQPLSGGRAEPQQTARACDPAPGRRRRGRPNKHRGAKGAWLLRGLVSRGLAPTTSRGTFATGLLAAYTAALETDRQVLAQSAEILRARRWCDDIGGDSGDVLAIRAMLHDGHLAVALVL